MLSPTNSTSKTAPVPPQDLSKPVLISEEPQNQLLQKVARTALAVLLVVVTLGLILLFYSFSDLQSFPWCCQTRPSTKEQPTISIPVPPPSPPLAVPRPSTPPLPSYHVLARLPHQPLLYHVLVLLLLQSPLHFLLRLPNQLKRKKTSFPLFRSKCL